MTASASSTVVGIAALALMAAFGGYTASFVCLVIERRAHGRTASGRSSCACGTPIPMWRNVPVVTWCVQRGRAACCGGRIPWWYAVTEFGSAVAPVGGALLLPGPPFAGALAGILLAISLTVVIARLQSGPALSGDGDQQGH